MRKHISLSEEDKKAIKQLEEIGKDASNELLEAYKKLQKNSKIRLIKRR